jgi:probable HAF family extracellular repeat protein
MKRRLRTTATGVGVLLLSLLAGVASASAGHADHPHGSANDNAEHEGVEYDVIELEGIDGNAAAGISVNNAGLVAGHSGVSGEPAIHATVWRHGTLTDLGTLGGPGTNSAVLWPVKNNRGLVVGITETDALDPNREQWSCSAFFPTTTGHTCRGFVWQDGEMRALPTHGGTHGFATAANNHGLVVGWAETEERDTTCRARDQVLGFLGAVWDTHNGDRIRALPPLAGTGDSASSATAINDRDQIVGISGECDQAVGRFTARHMVLWENGVPTEIPSFGSGSWNTPMAINNQGTVVGFANAEGTEGGNFNAVPFIWTKRDGTDDLDTLDGDPRGQALGINHDSQIVGLSRGADGDSAVLWQDGGVVDLNKVTPGYDGHLVYANDINGDGVITGQAISAETGQAVPFVATPVDD